MLTTFMPADLPAVLALCQRSLPADAWTRNILQRRIFVDMHGAARYRFALRTDGVLAGVLVALDRAHINPPYAGIILLVVDPAYQRRGIGTALFAAFEAQARADSFATIRAGRVAPNHFWPGVDAQNTPLIAVLNKRGYVQRGGTANMTVDLHARSWDTSADEARLATRGWHVRRAVPTDHAELNGWLPTWSVFWHWEGLMALQATPPSIFVALQHGVIHGFACTDVSMFANSFGPTGVAATARGAGVGTVLLKRCLADLHARGHATGEIGWVGPADYYRRAVGAVDGRTFGFYELGLR